MPFRAAEILEFVRTFTVHVEGVGHVCSFALFDFARHGDVRYGAPVDAPKSQRSRDGKMEQAYLNFKSQHPTWRANDDAGDAGDALLHNISTGDRLAASRHAAAAHAHAAAARRRRRGGRAAARRARRRRRRRRGAPRARAREHAGLLGLGAPGAALGATLGGMGSAAIGAGSLSACSSSSSRDRRSSSPPTPAPTRSPRRATASLAAAGAAGAPPAATARSTYAREAPLSPGRASAASAAAMEATTANISESVNAALYLRMDSYFTSNSHEEGGPSHVA